LKLAVKGVLDWSIAQTTFTRRRAKPPEIMGIGLDVLGRRLFDRFFSAGSSFTLSWSTMVWVISSWMAKMSVSVRRQIPWAVDSDLLSDRVELFTQPLWRRPCLF
jgi:hypothetical protein